MKQHRFLQEAGKLLNQMREIRRDLHQHPELGTQEVRTSRIVADYLKQLGLDVHTGIGGHGVVATLSAVEAGKCVALRADMDALPIEGGTQPSYWEPPVCSASFLIDSRAVSSSSFSPAKIRRPAVPYP
jgi:metal-dependent amidase/aminoacylase/carboxypeptidase family protein